ncbi:MAG: cadherin-like domain-containing protein, partial [Gammaproteobacteria bacterium]|nr:cadherin-like domain-containing protein [Gammaproteobacteria bacterium]
VRDNDSDPDNPDGDLSGHTVEVNGTLIAPQHGTVMVDGNGDVVYDHDDGNTATSDTYEYKLVDPDGVQFDAAMVTITIDHGNNAVPEANDDTGTVEAGESVTVNVLNNDSDANHSNEELTVTIETSPASGFAAVNGDGSVTYTHNGDMATSDSFQYRVTDPLGASDTATVHITITQDEGGACRNDLCAGDGDGGSYDPDMLTMTFVGGTCADSANSQEDKDDCTDFNPAGASGMVKIKVTNKEDADYGNAKVFFEGAVAEGEDFTFSASDIDENDFGSKIFVHVYDQDGNVLLQTVEIHTSCSAPLFEGDQFGSVRMGAADVDPEAQMCSAGEGRVHGSGHWSRGTGEKHDKIDFSFDAKVYKGGYKGKLKVHDKDIDLKIDAKTITSLSTGTGQMCDNYEMDGVATFAFTAVGKWEFGDEVIEDAEFFACGEDNGKNNEAPYDNLYVECVQSCGYNTAVRIMDASNDIDGGNIHLHDAIIDSTESGQAAAGPETMQSSSGGASSEPSSSDRTTTQSDGTRTASTSQTESSAQSEPAGSTDTVTLEPLLLSTAPAGTPMVVTAIVETHGGVIDGTPVTLRWTTADGLEGETTSLANAYGIAVFAVTVPAGDVDYTAWVDGTDSNGVRLTGF